VGFKHRTKSTYLTTASYPNAAASPGLSLSDSELEKFYVELMSLYHT
jgi:hypothetical protein